MHAYLVVKDGTLIPGVSKLQISGMQVNTVSTARTNETMSSKSTAFFHSVCTMVVVSVSLQILMIQEYMFSAPAFPLVLLSSASHAVFKSAIVNLLLPSRNAAAVAARSNHAFFTPPPLISYLRASSLKSTSSETGHCSGRVTFHICSRSVVLGILTGKLLSFRQNGFCIDESFQSTNLHSRTKRKRRKNASSILSFMFVMTTHIPVKFSMY